MRLIIAGGSSLRRFGQSIKRIVREVEEQSSGSKSNTRCNLQSSKSVINNHFLLLFYFSVDESRDVLVSRNVTLSRALKYLNKVSMRLYLEISYKYFDHSVILRLLTPWLLSRISI